MEWKKLSPAERSKWLSQQLKEIQQAKALIERFERLTRKWLGRAEKTLKQDQG